MTDLPDNFNFLIYGAYGFTGRLTARLAVARGLSPILAGRDGARLASLVDELGGGIEHRVFDLNNSVPIDDSLDRVDVVLHCAGPFSRTYRAMAEGCLRTGTHYLDISGEIPVHEALAGMDRSARGAGIMLLPGIGFDVVPTDCLAAQLKSRLPSATHLTLAICSVGPTRISSGTAKSVLEGFGRPGCIRKDGVIESVPHLSESRNIDFGAGPVDTTRTVVADVFSAYHSTGIPNIETYVAMPPLLRTVLKVVRPIGSWLSSPPAMGVIEKAISMFVSGPTGAQREHTYTVVWGEVSDDDGNVVSARARIQEAYTFTALSCLAAVQRLAKDNPPAGYQTPSTAFGAGFAEEISGWAQD